MEVVNLKGRKPQTLHEGEIYIGRPWGLGGWSLKGSIWHNPIRLPKNPTEEDLDRCLAQYEQHVLSSPALVASLGTLEGKTLACWCKPRACHGDVLVRLVEAARRSGATD